MSKPATIHQTREDWFNELHKGFFPRKVAGWQRATHIKCNYCDTVREAWVNNPCHLCGIMHNKKTFFCSPGCLSVHTKEHHMIGGQLRPEERGLTNIPKDRDQRFFKDYRGRMKDTYGDRRGIPPKRKGVDYDL